MRRFFIGTAGWSIPGVSAGRCPGEGTHLQRYARKLRCAEINSSFHRPHAPAVYARWARSVGPSFRFAVKVPRVITHDLKLRGARQPLERFLSESAGLGRKRGPLLVQLPPSLEFERRTVRAFFSLLRAGYDGFIVCEPRHPSWFTDDGNAALTQFEVARVAADPPPVPGADVPGGWPGIVYYRLHGAPRKYWSAYDRAYIEQLAGALRRARAAPRPWCIFDNTASGAAFENALDLHARLAAEPRDALVANGPPTAYR